MLLQKIPFLGSAGPGKNIIPVRKAAEADNDFMMTVRRLDKDRFVRELR